MIDDLKLAELLAARLCHDLSGPVGAAAAGAELLEDGGLDAETLGLVAESAAGASARLKLFRAALGPAGGEQKAGALRDLIEAYLRTAVSAASPGITISWRAEPAALDGDRARLLLNMVLIARDTLVRGGTIEANVAGSITVAARSPHAVMHEEARDVLLDGREPTGPRGAQAFWTRVLAERAGLELSVQLAEDGVILGV